MDFGYLLSYWQGVSEPWFFIFVLVVFAFCLLRGRCTFESLTRGWENAEGRHLVLNVRAQCMFCKLFPIVFLFCPCCSHDTAHRCGHPSARNSLAVPTMVMAMPNTSRHFPPVATGSRQEAFVPPDPLWLTALGVELMRLERSGTWRHGRSLNFSVDFLEKPKSTLTACTLAVATPQNSIHWTEMAFSGVVPPPPRSPNSTPPTHSEFFQFFPANVSFVPFSTSG